MSTAPSLAPAPSEAHAARRWWILVAIGVGTFISALDGSIVNALLPTMREALGATWPGSSGSSRSTCSW